MKSVMEVELDGSKYWRLNGQFHREDGPAVETSLGVTVWYFHGVIHREGGPALKYWDGRRYWYLNGLLHREDGPAIEHIDGHEEWTLRGNSYKKEWWINGVEYTEKEFNQWLEKKALNERLHSILAPRPKDKKNKI